MPTQLIWSFPDDSNNNVMGMKGSDSYFVIAETLRHILWQMHRYMDDINNLIPGSKK